MLFVSILTEGALAAEKIEAMSNKVVGKINETSNKVNTMIKDFDKSIPKPPELPKAPQLPKAPKAPQLPKVPKAPQLPKPQLPKTKKGGRRRRRTRKKALKKRHRRKSRRRMR